MALPDRFFTSTELYDELDAATFDSYSLCMALDGKWVESVYSIVASHPNPRQIGPRPVRTVQSPESTEAPEEPSPIKQEHVSTEKGWFFDKFFDTIMTQCALRRSGLLFVLPREHSLGDFAYCRYIWTADDQEDYLDRKIPPLTISDLPPSVPVVPMLAFTKNRAGTSRGPILSPSEFHRINQSDQCRLLLFDMFGIEGRNLFGPLTIIPTDDVSISSKDRTHYEDSFRKDNHLEFMERSPLLSQQLHTGYAITDYTLSALGPIVLSNVRPQDQWKDVWHLLEACSRDTPFFHPPGFQRSPYRFQLPLHEVHQLLVDRHASIEHEALYKASLVEQVE